ncbi:MAG: hypothetical protein ABIH04_01205 [Planctomycetota bacterium]
MKLLLITTALACIGLLTFATHIAAAQDPEQPQPGETESAEEPEQPQPGEAEKEKKKNGLELLKKAERIAREVSENHLRKQKVGKETQDKEEEIIKAFDDLIGYILDAQSQAQQQQQGQEGQQGQQGQQGQPSQQSGKPGGSKPSSMAGKTSNPQKGKATGFQKPSGKGDSEGKQKEEWGFLPDKDFEATAREESSELPPGYQRLIERYRRVVITEMTKIRR